MFKHILVALDGKPESERAMKQAVAMARLANAQLTGISVIEHLPAYAASVGEVDDMVQQMGRFLGKVQDNAAKVAQDAGVAFSSVTRAGNAAEGIVKFARDNGVDLIIVGAKGRGGLGSTADRVTESAPCSVLVARIDLLSIRVKDVMTRDAFSLDPSTPLETVVKSMVERGLKAVPVVENGQVVGIITGGDLLSRTGMAVRLSIQRILPPSVFLEQVKQLSQEGKTARSIMTSPVITIAANENVATAATTMVSRSIKRLPVLDESGQFVGIISRFDILALAAARGPHSGVFPALEGVTPRTAADVMIREVPAVSPDTPLSDVVNELVATPLRRVVVVDERRRVLGIIVDTNLIQAARAQKTGLVAWLLSYLSAPEDTAVVKFAGQASDVMERRVFSVHTDTPLAEVVQLMIDRSLKRIVVVDRDNRLMGMVNRENILRALTQ